MRIKTFIASDMRAAMAAIRAELGEEALILSHQKTKGEGVLVRVAIEGSLSEERLEEGVARSLALDEDERREALAEPYAVAFREGLIARLRGAAPPSPRPQRYFNRAELLGLLRSHRLADGLAHALAEAAEQSRLSDMTLALAAALDQRLRSAPLELAQAKGFVILGPRGTGKTVMAGRIAAQAVRAGRQVRLIAADPEGAGAVERLRRFADHVGADLDVAESEATLLELTRQSSAAGELALVDTAGFDPRDAAAGALCVNYGALSGLECLAVVSAQGDAEETGEICAALAGLGVARLLISALDGTRRLGSLAAAATSSLALAHVSRSPFLDGHLETLSALSLARALLETATPLANAGETACVHRI
ncbi:MAG: ATP-binding protein [Rhizomicrobium sp.]